MARLFTSYRLIKLYEQVNRHFYRGFNSSKVYNKDSIFCEKLTNRVLVEIKGEDGPSFLQGLMTNDVNHLVNGDKSAVQLPCIYSMMLNIQGRVLYDILLYKDKNQDEKKLLLECDSGIKDKLIKHLKMYRLRKKIDINLNENTRVWSVFSQETFPVLKNDLEKINGGIMIVKDPRTNTLGYRVLAEKNAKIEEILNDDIIKVEGKYTERLYQEGIGEGIDDLPSGNCFPLECNGDYLNGVSFHKGCYIGQELTSRIHHTGVVRKRIMPIYLKNGPVTSLNNSTDIENETGKKIGKLRGLVNQNGIALMRIEETLTSKEVFWNNDGSKVEIIVKKPNWWPLEASK